MEMSSTILFSRIPRLWISESPFLSTLFEENDNLDPSFTLDLPFPISYDYLCDLLQVDSTGLYLDVATWMLYYHEIAHLFDFLNMSKNPLEYVRPGDYRDWKDISKSAGVPLRGIQKIAFGWDCPDPWQAMIESLEEAETDLKWVQWFDAQSDPAFRLPPKRFPTIYHLFQPRRATYEMVLYLKSRYTGYLHNFTPNFCEGLIKYRNRELMARPEIQEEIVFWVNPESLFQIAFRQQPGERREDQLSYLQFLIEIGFQFHHDSTYITETFRSKNVLIWDFLHRLYPEKFQYNMMQIYHTLQELILVEPVPVHLFTLSEKQEMVDWIRVHYQAWWLDMIQTHTQSLFLPVFMVDYGKQKRPLLDESFVEYLFAETGSIASPMYYVYSVILKGTIPSEEAMNQFQWKEEHHTVQYPAFRLAIHHDHLPTVQYMVKHHYYSDTEDAKYAILWAVPHRDIFRFLWKRYFRYNLHLFQESRQYKNSIYYYLYEEKQLENIHFLLDHKVKPPTDFVRYVKGEKVHMDFYWEHATPQESGWEEMRREREFNLRVLQFLE